jgi:hypothetical protein
VSESHSGAFEGNDDSHRYICSEALKSNHLYCAACMAGEGRLGLQGRNICTAASSRITCWRMSPICRGRRGILIHRWFSNLSTLQVLSYQFNDAFNPTCLSQERYTSSDSSSPAMEELLWFQRRARQGSFTERRENAEPDAGIASNAEHDDADLACICQIPRDCKNDLVGPRYPISLCISEASIWPSHTEHMLSIC